MSTQPPAPVSRDERRRQLERRFKVSIVMLTLAALVTLIGVNPRARFQARQASRQLKRQVLRATLGQIPERAELDQENQDERTETRRRTLESLTRFYQRTTPEMRRLFDVAGMDPAHALIGLGRADNGFLLSSLVFEPADDGRNYRLKPKTASVWLRQVTLIDGPFGLFLVPDTPEMRQAAAAAGAIVDETSRQTTNSWGLRGPEPDPDAEVRGIVLGDSFMQGMFNDDEHTPPLDLQRTLAAKWGRPVSVLNTGHIGYAPEQYFRALEAYGDRFKPQFVVVSVCPNDFGDGDAVMSGAGEDWDEATYWIEEILRWCRARQVTSLLVIMPVDRQILGSRKEGKYFGRISDLFPGSGASYLYPFETFLDEHLRLAREGAKVGQIRGKCLLFNGHIDDNHLSPLGSALWAELTARRLDLLLDPAQVPAPSSVAGAQR